MNRFFISLNGENNFIPEQQGYIILTEGTMLDDTIKNL